MNGIDIVASGDSMTALEAGQTSVVDDVAFARVLAALEYTVPVTRSVRAPR